MGKVHVGIKAPTSELRIFLKIGSGFGIFLLLFMRHTPQVEGEGERWIDLKNLLRLIDGAVILGGLKVCLAQI